MERRREAQQLRDLLGGEIVVESQTQQQLILWVERFERLLERDLQLVAPQCELGASGVCGRNVMDVEIVGDGVERTRGGARPGEKMLVAVIVSTARRRTLEFR